MNNFKKKKPKHTKKINDNIELIKPLIENNAISTKEIRSSKKRWLSTLPIKTE